jgi:pyruvate/oxaloacetate carboxyltransferase
LICNVEIDEAASDRLAQVLEGIPCVRADLGYPIMATPYSRFTRVQAVINIVSGVGYRAVAAMIMAGCDGQDADDSQRQPRCLQAGR